MNEIERAFQWIDTKIELSAMFRDQKDHQDEGMLWAAKNKYAAMRSALLDARGTIGKARTFAGRSRPQTKALLDSIDRTLAEIEMLGLN